MLLSDDNDDDQNLMPTPTGPPNRRKVFTSYPWKRGRVYMSHTWYFDVKFTDRDREARRAQYESRLARFGGEPVPRQDEALALRYPYERDAEGHE